MYFDLCPECPPESVCMLSLTLTFVSLPETMTYINAALSALYYSTIPVPHVGVTGG